MKLKDFIVENKQVIIEGVNYNYEVINMEEVFSELLAESPANIKCIGNIALVAKLIKLLGNSKDKTLALADVDDLNQGTAFNNENELNAAVATSLINTKNWSKNIEKLIGKFPDMEDTLMKIKGKIHDTSGSLPKDLTKVIAGSCEFTKEVIKMTKSTFIMAWKDTNGHIPGEAA